MAILSGGFLGNLLSGLTGNGVADPQESFFAKKGKDDFLSRTLRGFGFEQPISSSIPSQRENPLLSNIVNPASAPIVREAIKRKVQTQGSALPESINEFTGNRSPAIVGEPEYEEQAPKNEKGGEGIGGFFGGILGNLVSPEGIRGMMNTYEQQLGRDDLGLKPNIPKLDLVNNFEKSLRRKAFIDSTDENGQINEQKLVGNLTKLGFGEDAFKIQEGLKDKSVKLALEMSKMGQKERERNAKVVDGEKMIENFQKKFPGAKVTMNNKGDVSIVHDPTAQANAKSTQIKTQLLKRKFEEDYGMPVGEAGISIGGGRSLPSGGQIAQPQIGGRGIATVGEAGRPVEQGIIPSKYDPFNANPEMRPANRKEKLDAFKSLSKKLDLDEAKMPSPQIVEKINNLDQIVKQSGDIVQTQDGDYFFKPSVDTGKYVSMVQEMFPGKDYQELRAAINKNSILNLPQGMSQLFNSLFERQILEASMPGAKNKPVVNRNLALAAKASSDSMLEYRDFRRQFGAQNLNLQNADTAWKSYKDNNPELLRDKKGLLMPTGMNIPWQDYFKQEGEGGKPIPINWNNLNSKFSANQDPLIQDDSLPGKLKDDEMYISKAGLISGKDLKDRISRSKKRGK